jgi:hypothetical protein
MRLSLVLGCLCLLDVSRYALGPINAILTSPSVFESAVNAVYWFRKTALQEFFGLHI